AAGASPQSTPPAGVSRAHMIPRGCWCAATIPRSCRPRGCWVPGRTDFIDKATAKRGGGPRTHLLSRDSLNYQGAICDKGYTGIAAMNRYGILGLAATGAATAMAIALPAPSQAQSDIPEC